MASDACNVALRGQVIYVRVCRVISPEVFVCWSRAASPRAGSSYGDGADRDVGRSDEWHGWPTEHIPAGLATVVGLRSRRAPADSYK